MLLIEEKMQWVVAWYEWKALWWKAQASHRTGIRDDILHGVRAYAAKQAWICERMAESCAAQWVPALQTRVVLAEWVSQYLAAGKGASTVSGSAEKVDIYEDDEGDNNGDEIIDDDRMGNEIDDEDLDDLDVFELNE